MTLIVSIRTPEGIVLAGDSLTTLIGSSPHRIAFDFVCPACAHEQRLEGIVPIETTISTWLFARKVFPVLQGYGVGTAGVGQLNGKTIYFLMCQLEEELIEAHDLDHFNASVDSVAEMIGQRALELLHEQIRDEGEGVSEGSSLLEFQVVGYDRDEPVTIELKLGKDIRSERHTDPGITTTGETDVVHALLESSNPYPDERPVYDMFSLQDAIAFADYLISTTATQQRFSNTIPSVGGEIDIALITPFDNFTWIRQKSLMGFEGVGK